MKRLVALSLLSLFTMTFVQSASAATATSRAVVYVGENEIVIM